MNHQDQAGTAESAAALRAATGGAVFVERHMFQLSDPEADSFTNPPNPTEEQPVTFGAGHKLALFHSALEDGKPHVDVELWSAQPPQPDGDWDFSVTERLTVGGSEQYLVSAVSSFPSDHQLSVPPGEYVLGVWCQGRDEARAHVEAWEAEDAAAWEAGELEDEDDEEQGDAAGVLDVAAGVERWLLRFWPAG